MTLCLCGHFFPESANPARVESGWGFALRLDELEEPILMPTGTKMIVTSHFDNSRENRWNPDPDMWVYWGDDSRDEMMEGWFDYRRKLDHPLDPTEAPPQP